MLNIKVDRVENKFVQKEIYLFSPTPIKITYSGRGKGFDFIKINDEMKNATAQWGFTRKIPFMLAINGVEHPAFVEVKVGLIKIKSFRLVIENTLVYTEGEFDTPFEPAVPFDSPDLSKLDPKPNLKNPLFLMFVITAIPFILTKNYQMEWNVPYEWAAKYLSAPIVLSLLWLSYKYSEKIDKEYFSGPSYFFSKRAKMISRYLFAILIAATTTLLSGGWITAVNVFLTSGRPIIVKGELQNSFNSNGWDISKIKTNEAIIEVPVRSCMGLEGKKGLSVETAMLRGALGVLYIPASERDRSRLAAFYLKNASDSRWLRYSDYEYGSKLLSSEELKVISEKWISECNKGIVTSCRVAAYFDGKSELQLLTKSCEGGDLTGCLGIFRSKEAKEEEKKNAVEKMYIGCLNDSSTCECNWNLYEKNVDKKRFLAQEEKFCSLGERWACGGQYRRNNK